MPRHSAARHPHRRMVVSRARSRGAAVVATLALAATSVLAGVVPAVGAPGDPGWNEMFLAKTVSKPVVAVDEVFSFELAFDCKSNVNSCEDAVLVDTLPTGLELVRVDPLSANIPATVRTQGNTVTVTFTKALDHPNTPGSIGLFEGATGSVRVYARFLPRDANEGDLTVTNTASLTASNRGARTSSADVTVDVVPTPKATATKSWAPAVAGPGPGAADEIAEPGAAKRVTLGFANASNFAASSLVVTEPSDPSRTAARSAFDVLDLASLTGADVTWPDGAVDVAVTAYVGGTPHTTGAFARAATTSTTDLLAGLPGGLTAADVTGLRLEFSGAMPTGASGSLAVSATQRTTPRSGGVLAGTVQNSISVVAAGSVGGSEHTSPAASAADSFMLVRAELAATSAKTAFSPAQLPLAGATSTVTIRGTSTANVQVQGLTLTDPAAGSTGFFGASGVLIEGFGADGAGAGVVWPSGATSARLEVTTSAGTHDATATSAHTLPSLGELGVASWGDVTGFSITFAGPIPVGASAEVPYRVQAGPSATVTAAGSPLTNCVSATTSAAGETSAPSTPGCAVLTLVDPTVAATGSKRLTSTNVSTAPGTTTTAVLAATARVGGPAGGNARPSSLVLTEQRIAGDVGSERWWEVFGPTAVAATPVASGDVLTAEVLVGGVWTAVHTATGPTTVELDLQDAVTDAGLGGPVTGVRFVVTRAAGFEDGATVRANLTFAVRPGTSFGAEQVTNCVVPSASLGSRSANGAQACAALTGVVLPGGGQAHPLTKQAKSTVVEGAVDAAGQRMVDLRWSTNGAGDLARVEVSDMAETSTGDGIDGSDSFWDVFDIERVAPITSGAAAQGGSAWDPYLVFDRIAAVELWDGTTWRRLTNDPCAVAATCAGAFPGVTLTTADRAAARAVRLVYVARPASERATVLAALVAAGDWRAAIAPSETGVAAVPAGDTIRGIRLQAQLRDTLRSDSTLPVNDARSYNACAAGAVVTPPLPACVGQVVNDGLVRGGSSAASMSPVGPGTAGNLADERTVTILPMALAVQTTKSWLRADAYGQLPQDLALPGAGTPETGYPHATLSLTATNATASSAVDRLTITEPAALGAAGSNPFDRFTVTGVAAVAPNGADPARTVYRVDTGSGLVAVPVGSLTAAFLADAVRVEVEFNGRIAPGATGALTLDTRLRSTVRGTGDPVTATAPGAPVANTVLATATDGRVCVDSTAGATRDEQVSPCVLEPATAQASDAVTISAPSTDVAVTKDISRATVDRDLAPAQPFDVRLTVQNVGNSPATALALTDAARMPAADAVTGAQPDEHASGPFYDAVTLTGASVTTLPTGAQQMRLDVLVGSTFAADGTDLSVTGGTWTTGAPVPAATGALALPGGTAWADVVGVRVVFLGSALASPGQVGRVTLGAVLRDQLRSGGAPSATGGVPAAMNDSTPNPGEAVVGRVGDTVTGRADAGSLPSTVRTATDDLSVRAGRIAVQVSKTPTGSVKPGSIVPFTLSSAHTGTADLPDPVLTDHLPTDGIGQVLSLDTTETGLVAGSGNSPWGVELVGPGENLLGDPQALRHNPGETAVTIDGVVVPAHSVAVTWQPGAVLLPGQTIKVTLPLAVRSSALGATTNTLGFGSTSTTRYVQDATCAATGGGTRSYVGADRSCRVAVPLDVTSSGAFTSRKDVRAWPTDLGAMDTRPTASTCAADADGYVAYPCAAVVQPGGLMRWRTSVTAGNVPATSLVLVDVLPHRGDVGEETGLPRHTDWRPTWDGVAPELDGAPAGTTLTVLYATAADPAITYTSSPDSTWSATPPADPTALTGLKLVLGFTGVTGGQMPAGSTVRAAWTMRAPIDLSGDAWQGTVAWNTFGYQGVSDDTYTTQPRKAGVVFPEGSLGVSKTMRDDTGLGLLPSSVDVLVTCTVPTDPTDPAGARRPVVLPGGGVVTLDAANGWEGQVDHVPGGATCVVTEPDRQGASSTTFTPAGADPSASAPIEVLAGETAADNHVTVANVYEATSLTITKQSDGASGALATSTFDLALVCALAGSPLALPPADAAFTLRSGDRRTIDELPVGAECVVTETSSHGATIGYRVGGVVRAGDGTLTLVADAADNVVGVENAFSELDVAKAATVTSVQAGDTFDYTLTVANTGPAPTGDVRLTDRLPAELAVAAVTAPAPWACTIDPTDPADPAAGETVSCAYGSGATLAAGSTAPIVTVTVGVAAGIAVDELVNVATVRWTDTGSPNPAPPVREDDDVVRVPVRRIVAASAPTCVADARWLDVDLDLRNIDAGATPVTLTWFADADQDGAPDGAAVHVETIPAGGDLSTRLLWPGTTVDQDGAALTQPGMRVVRAGETPTWQNLVLDPALATATLRGGVLVRVEAGTAAATTLLAVHPAAGVGCDLVRAPGLGLTKTASVDRAGPNREFEYALAVRNTGLGATDDVTLTDQVPSGLRVTGVRVAGAATVDGPTWLPCTVTGRDASGFGGLVTCVLDGWLAPRSSAPVVTLAVQASSSPETGRLVNTAGVVWTDPADPAAPRSSGTGTAAVQMSSVLATTGAALAQAAIASALLVGLGVLAVMFRRRRRTT